MNITYFEVEKHSARVNQFWKFHKSKIHSRFSCVDPVAHLTQKKSHCKQWLRIWLMYWPSFFKHFKKYTKPKSECVRTLVYNLSYDLQTCLYTKYKIDIVSIVFSRFHIKYLFILIKACGSNKLFYLFREKYYLIR